VLALINKYKAVQESFKKAEYFVNIAQGALGVFEDSIEKKVLQRLTQFTLNRSF
jgi:octaprenyl-diphosphate synthase